MAGTNVAPHDASVADPGGVAEVQAAMDAAMAAFEARQATAYAPMGGAGPRPAEATQQPFSPSDPGDGPGGVT